MSNCPRWFRFPFVLALLFLSFASYPDSSVSAGEAQWVEVRSPNFSVVTDAGEKRGREVATHFELMRAAFGTLMTKAKVNLPVPLQIVAFRNTKEMRQVAPIFNGKPTQVAGLFQAGSDRSFIMLDMSVDNPYPVVYHEYAHQLLNGNTQTQSDPWFEEGFAEYFSSIEVDSKQVRVGKVPVDEYQILHQIGLMKIADLFKVRQYSSTYNESGDHRTIFYAESGMLTHYIYDNHLLEKVSIYFDLRKKNVTVEDAIQQAFGMSAPQFDKVLHDYAYAGRYKYYPIPAPANVSESAYTVAGLRVEDANAVIADIHLHMQDYHDKALDEFADILKADPNNAAACRGLGYAYLQKQNFSQAGEYFKRASELDSKDPRVHYYYAMLMAHEHNFGPDSDTAAMRKELETSISLDPNFGDAYALLGFAESTAGNYGPALDAMRKAITINPRNEEYRFNMAGIFLRNRQPDQAIQVLETIRNSPNPALAAQASSLIDSAREFQQNLQAASPGTMIIVRNQDGPAQPTTSAAPVSTGAVKFLKGMITSVDCSAAPGAVVTMISGAKTMKMQVADRNHVIVIGADAFSCSWNKQKIAVNYHEKSPDEGSVISLEIQ
jgi:tetratricopeptide (TPR) repeat protein